MIFPRLLMSRWSVLTRSMCLVVLGLWLAMASLTGAFAQTTTPPPPDYSNWQMIAGLAENAVDNPNSSERVLTSLRAQIVDLRARFQEIKDRPDVSSAALREQIAALGPAPADGQTESEEITARRQELNEQLAQRQAPRIAAEEAYARADAIVRLIDGALRSRQTSQLLERGPSPLNPGNWWAGLNTLVSSFMTLQGEVYNAWLAPETHESWGSVLPFVLGALALGLLLLVRGRHWAERLTLSLQYGRLLLRGKSVLALFVSLAQLLVPLAGLWLLSQAYLLTGLYGRTTAALADAFVPAGMAIFIARWLSMHIFPLVDDPRTALNLSKPMRRHARITALGMGAVIAVQIVFDPLFDPSRQPAGAIAVLKLVVIVLGAFMLFRMGRALRTHTPRQRVIDDQTVDASPFFDRMIRLGARAIVIVALFAVVAGIAGYMQLGAQVVFPAIKTVALFGALIVLHRLVIAVTAMVIGDADAAADGLISAVSGLVIFLLAVPPLALIWGARITDLEEMWSRFATGVQLGGTQISPLVIVSFFVVFAIGYMLTRGLQGALGSSILPKTKMESGAQKAIVSGVGYVGITLAALVAFSTAGIDLSGLAIVAGALSVGLGFGLQNIVSNFVSGIILLIERPVSEGDWVEVGSTSGTIQRISVRSTLIQTFDRSKVIVPNADLITGAVTNYTKSTKTGRIIVPVGVAYGTDTRRVESILREIVEAQPLVVLDPPPSVLLMNFGADAIEFEIRAILRDINFGLSVRSEINHQVAARFAQEGIEIPFAQRDIWLRNPEALAQTGAAGAGTEGGALPSPTAPQASQFTGADLSDEAINLVRDDTPSEDDGR